MKNYLQIFIFLFKKKISKKSLQKYKKNRKFDYSTFTTYYFVVFQIFTKFINSIYNY